MGTPARQETHIETLTGPVVIAAPPRPTQMPINPTERSWRMRRGMRTLSNRALTVLRTTKESASRMASDVYNQARRCTADGYSRLAHRTGELSRQTRQAARYARHEYPVRTLGVIAGTAFVAGMALRIWRSR